MLKRWLYRSRQFFGALLGRVSKEEMSEARRVLGPDLYSLFARMPQQYRSHGIAVYKRVREAGCEDANVWRAALLHDCGKYDPVTGQYVTILHRVVVVLLEASSAGRALLKELSRHRGSRGPLNSLLYPLYLNASHTRRGAEIVAQHGASQAIVRMVADHHKYSGQSDMLKALQAADDRS